MGSMRQRLLLVAGWAAAAVVASLVSTGAVAVAGGQVTDRPLRPLSASEVAALTEECGSYERAPCLRQLDSSADQPPPVTTAPTTNSRPEGDEQGASPLHPVAPTAGTEPPPEDETVIGPISKDAPEPGAKIVELQGGRVSVSGADGKISILWVIPNPGYVLVPATDHPRDDGVPVVFSDGSHESYLVARWDSQLGLTIESPEISD